MSLCVVASCQSKKKIAEYCVKHYHRNWRGQSLTKKTAREMTEEERFFSKVRKTQKCWLWLASINAHGYGRFAKDGSWVFAHRWSWVRSNGRDVADGMCVLHRCHNPSCVRPDHLYEGTHQQNMRDMVLAGRTRHLRGEDNAVSKLKEKDVRHIRSISAPNKKKLAKQYGCTAENIHSILIRKTWKHVG